MKYASKEEAIEATVALGGSVVQLPEGREFKLTVDGCIHDTWEWRREDGWVTTDGEIEIVSEPEPNKRHSIREHRRCRVGEVVLRVKGGTYVVVNRTMRFRPLYIDIDRQIYLV